MWGQLIDVGKSIGVGGIRGINTFEKAIFVGFLTSGFTKRLCRHKKNA
jgi:hypothetical protein